jgi:hypothetical protein
VQKLRDKYNECLELAETVKSRMLAVSSHQDFRNSPRPQADKLLFEAAMRLVCIFCAIRVACAWVN